MKVLHLAAANRWTGAAAPALAEAEALRHAGVETFYGFVGGYLLSDHLRDRRLGDGWALPILEKRQNPIAFLRASRAVRALVQERGIDLIHAHLTNDHVIALWAARRTGVKVVRTFHAKKAIRRDPLSKSSLHRTSAVCVINASFLSASVLAGHGPVFTAPPVNHNAFNPGPENARARYGLDAETPVLGFIGKIAPDRGFEVAIRVLSLITPSHPTAKLMITGRGPYRVTLEALTRELGVENRVIWTGYQDEGLPGTFRAASVWLFIAKGSDEGHRAIAEAMACGTPVASYPLPGVRELMGSVASDLVSEDASIESLAALTTRLLSIDRTALSQRCAERASEFSYENSAERLIAIYERALRG